MFDFPQNEEKILDFWKEKNIIQKTFAKNKGKKKFVFFEGPPFANGLPGIHHLLARAFKDIIIRYRTMKGFYIERKAGWDTHGLPTEMEAEKKLGIKTKKEIEELGIEKFIEKCRESVFTYKKEWEEFSKRISYWIDFENAYITCDNNYIESLWWILKNIWKKGLLFQDYKVVPYCPRCGTSLSSHEVAQGYKRVKENAIYVKFKVKKEENTYFLVWTTTPWTLPANVAIAVNSSFDYLKVKTKTGEILILAKERIEVLGEEKEEILEEMKGENLLNKEYYPLYPQEIKGRLYQTIPAEFVSLEEGTGLVHIAPAFGEEDMEVVKKENRERKEEEQFPILMTVDGEGKMKTKGYKWEGMFVKDADPLIISDLKERNILFKEELYEHDYPFCWRCKTPLVYYAKSSWFIKITEVRNQLIENSQEINWIPSYIKKGRFGEWLKEIKDWNLSRERYWGTPLPIWQCQKCGYQECIGSIKELREKSGEKEINDLHRPFIDKIVYKCEKCGGEMKRVSEVIDCWFDSGSMPFAQWHYPFENKEKIDNQEAFPADFIAEGIDQTRGWFYTLLAVSTLIEIGPAYKNVICLGLILDAKGQKMSKSRGNIIKPEEVVNKFGADCARLYFYTVNQAGETKKFDFQDVQTLERKFFDTLWQSYNFFSIYKEEDFNPEEEIKPNHILDKWIISRLESLNVFISENLNQYKVVEAGRALLGFVDELSNWYIRRSRLRFQDKENKKANREATQVLYYVLLRFSQLIAPFTPFIAEKLYQSLGGKEESVHLSDWPEANQDLINKEIEEKMEETRNIASQVLAERVKAGIKVRQPLSKLIIKDSRIKEEPDLISLLKEEINVKEVIFNPEAEKEIVLDVTITPELKEEGIMRDFIRFIQILRKKAGLKAEDKILIYYQSEDWFKKLLEKYRNYVLKKTIAEEIKEGKEEVEAEREIKLDGKEIWLGIKVKRKEE